MTEEEKREVWECIEDKPEGRETLGIWRKTEWEVTFVQFRQLILFQRCFKIHQWQQINNSSNAGRCVGAKYQLSAGQKDKIQNCGTYNKELKHFAASRYYCTDPCVHLLAAFSSV